MSTNEQLKQDAAFLRWILDHCTIVYFGADYPVEHNPHAKKNGEEFLRAEFNERPKP